MGDPYVIRLWLGRGLYLVLAAAIAFLMLLPLDAVPGGLPLPDFLVAATCAWVLRRPEQVPAPMIVGVFLAYDFLFLRPPGLWTLLMLFATEFLRAREPLARSLPFALEMLMVAAALALATLVNSLLLALFLVPAPPAAIVFAHLMLTLLAYPVVVLALRYAIGLRRVQPGEMDSVEGRI